MADTENTTFNTSRVLGNEIVKADDFNFGFESLIHNISKFAQMIFECKKDFVIGGKVTVDSGTNVKVAPIFGVCASTGEPFGMTESSDVISITQNDYYSRVDIIEAKGEWVAYDEQQRAFNDLDNDIVTYQNIDIKQRLKVTYRVKNGVNDSVVAPVTDEGWVKIAEIKYTKGTVELSESDILNITADVADLENSEWTNEKTKTYNVNYISSINERFRVEHNVDGTHKNGVVHAAQVDFGTGNKQVNAAKIPITSSGTVGSATYGAGNSVNATLVSFANQITTIYNNYLKYGANCFKGEVALSLLADGNTLKNPLIFGAAGDGTAYCKIGTKNIFSITADGKLRMAAGYIPSDSMDVVTKSVTDSINTIIQSLDNRVKTLESTSDTTVYSNNVFSRFSYVKGKIDAATTANINLSGVQTIDGVSLTVGMIVLVKNQTDAKTNGIYEVNTNKWQRHTGYNTFDLIKHKFYVIGNGTINKNKIFYTPQENFSDAIGSVELNFSEYQKINTQQLNDASVTADKIGSGVKLANPNALTVNGKTYDGSSAVNAGVQTIANGGTGQSTANAAANAFINSLSVDESVPVDNDYYVAQYVNGGTTTTTYHRRPISKLWEYIKTKIASIVTPNNPTLAWGATSSLGTIGDKTFNVSMPANPNTDTKVTQAVSTVNGSYPILAAATASKVSSSTETAIFSTLLSMNPATGQMTGWSNGGAYVICSTAASTQDKLVTLPGLTLTTGMTVTVLFSNGNKVASPSLNVNSKGAKSIKVYLNGSKNTVTTKWDAGTSMTLMYDGTDFVVLGNPVVMSKLDTTSSYIKYANGLLIQWKIITTTNIAETIPFSFPVDFSSLPVCFGAINRTDSYYPKGTVSIYKLTVSGGSLQVIINNSYSTYTSYSVLAIGY